MVQVFFEVDMCGVVKIIVYEYSPLGQKIVGLLNSLLLAIGLLLAVWGAIFSLRYYAPKRVGNIAFEQPAEEAGVYFSGHQITEFERVALKTAKNGI
jgi:hypothetical protein